MPTSPDELRERVEEYLEDLDLSPELGQLAAVARYALDGGGKRIRPLLCLATGEAVGVEPRSLLPAAAALELVHTFSLVHDDLPALDDDAFRRGRPSVHAEFGEAIAILAGDALLAEAFRLALTYSSPQVARELAQATLGMIGGQYIDVRGETGDVLALHRLKTGRLFAACIGCALWVAEVPQADQAGWRRFGDQVGLLFQVVDDLLDGDGYAREHGPEQARALADTTAERATALLDTFPADTSILAAIVSTLSTRVS